MNRYPPMTRHFDAWSDRAFGEWLLDSDAVDTPARDDDARAALVFDTRPLPDWSVVDFLVTPGLSN